MATSKEYFEKNVHMEVGGSWRLVGSSAGDDIEIDIKSVLDFEGCSKYLKIYVPETHRPDIVVAHVLSNIEEALSLDGGLDLVVGMAGTDEKIDKKYLRFSGRVLVYTPSIVDKNLWSNLSEEAGKNGISLLVRDGNYVNARNVNEKPLAFISHDSRDKDEFVRPLANRLATMLFPVWYDEFKLVPGQSLRESIESGLKAAPKCVVVLSKNFFSNPGWGKREFESIYQREIIEGKRVMIPIWLNVTKQEVYEFSPILLDTMGIDGSIGVDGVAGKLVSALQFTPPKTLDISDL